MSAHVIALKTDSFGRPLTLPDVSAERRTWRVLLVDDDEVFCQVVKKRAEQFGIELHAFNHISELARAGDLSGYDVALVDHYLGKFNGSTVSRFLSTFHTKVPVVMISSSSLWWHKTGARWPANVRRFVHKDRSVSEILVQAMEVAKGITTSIESDPSEEV
jgi:DNA-binding response OmpR family regulator